MPQENSRSRSLHYFLKITIISLITGENFGAEDEKNSTLVTGTEFT